MIAKSAIALVALCALCHPALATPTIQTIDAPGEDSTIPVAINESGLIAGGVQDSSGLHGFIRAADGTFTIFDPPGSTETSVNVIKAAGDTVGAFTLGFSTVECFIRSAAGTLTVFAPAGTRQSACTAFAMNDKGDVVGDVTKIRTHAAFIRNAAGRTRNFLKTGSGYVTVIGMNNAATVVGLTDNASQTNIAGFLCTRNGAVTVFDVPGDINGTYVDGINDAGLIAGSYGDGNLVFHGYLRAADGTITVFDVPGASQTYTDAIRA